MKDIYQIEKLIKRFENKTEFSTKDVFLFFQNTDSDIKKDTVLRRISVLIKKGIIKRVGNGIYQLGQEINYKPIIEKKLITLYTKLNKKIPFLNFCIWNTKQFNEFMLHQPFRFNIIVETEKDSSEYVFHFLKQENKEVYLNPDKTEINNYVSFADNAIVIKDLISEAPILKQENISTITIEKILVDVFCDINLFAAQQGSELEVIFRTAFEKYTINKTKLFRYSDRRKRRKELKEFIQYLQIN